MEWNNLRFYVICPKTSKKIGLYSIPSNPYEAKYKFKEFSVKCPYCHDEHRYTSDYIHAEPVCKHHWLEGIILAFLFDIFILPFICYGLNLSGMYFTFGVIVMFIGYVMGDKYDRDMKEKAKEYESRLKGGDKNGNT